MAAAKNTELLGREPVITVTVIVTLLIAILPVFGWPAETVGIVAGALVVLGGAVEAALISVDKLLPLLVGVAKAILAVVAAFGVHVPGNWVVALMSVLTVVAGLQVRKQVVPAKRAQGHRDIDIPGFIQRWNDAERAASHTGIGRSTRDFPTDLDTQRDAPPLPDRPSEDDAPTQTFRLEPNTAYRLDATVRYDGEQQTEDEGRHHRREWRTNWGHSLGPDLST